MSNLPSSLLCDDLFLLVGTNPLPNWVVTQLLVKKSSGCVHLAYTSGVSEQARRLQAVLKAEGFQVSLLQTAESDEQRIFDDVRRRAEALLQQSPDRKIGLNYTGGTKMMSVHAHRAVLKANLPEPILSYLDARSLRLKFDQHPPQGWSIALAPDVRISIKKLLRLHDDLKEDELDYEDQSKGVVAAQGLVQVHRHYAGQSVWREWCSRELKVGDLDIRRLKRNRVEYKKQVDRLDKIALLHRNDFSKKVETQLQNDRRNNYSPQAVRSFLQQIDGGYQKMLDALHVADGATLQSVAQQNAGDSQNVGDSVEWARWLDGMWLEHYTLSQIESIRTTAEINQDGLAINLETKNAEGREFEADVIALRGYQLFYFSCYTGSDFKQAKMKLFEAMVRATQLGGDEAKIALVTCVDQQANLRKQL